MYTNLYNRRGNTSLVAKISQVETKVFQSTRTNCLNIPTYLYHKIKLFHHTPYPKDFHEYTRLRF